MIVFIIFITLCVSFYVWMKQRYGHWSRKGIAGPKPVLFAGNFGPVIRQQKSANECITQVCKSYPDEKLIGIFQGFLPTIVVKDPEMIKAILIKDFPIFQDRWIKLSDDRFSDHLFGVEGEPWRILRSKLTPIFSSGKIKNMVPLIQKCIDEYLNYVENLVEKNADQEIRDLVGKYTLEVIGSCVFGVDMNTFSDKRNVFRDVANKIFSLSVFLRARLFMEMFIPGLNKFLYKYFGMPILDKKLENFFVNLVSNIVKEREGKPKVRHDFMDQMIFLKEQGRVGRRDEYKSEIEIDNVVLAAQAMVFYAAGFDTSAASMSFMLHEFALNKDIQTRVYNEITTVLERHGGVLTYESIKEMAYLEMAVDEALRKYPISGILLRKASEDYTFPNTKYTIDKGTRIMIPVCSLHADPEYYPSPDVYDPERFSPERRGDIPACVYLPFGEGPRNCIAKRFAKVLSMMATAAFLMKFQVDPSEKTRRVLSFSHKSLTLTASHGIWLNISKR